MPFQNKPALPLLAAFAAVVCSVASAQTPNSETHRPQQPVLAVEPVTPCNPWVVQALPTELTFRQRVCLSVAHLTSPATFLGAAVVASYGQWRNNAPSIYPRDVDDFASRLGYVYERRVARTTGELLAGYLHHEDPRPHHSNATGVWRRTGDALLSVIDSPGPDGHARVALIPIAGALSSGLTSMAVFPHENGWSNGFERSGIVYGSYFARALVHEFSPELWLLAPPFMRKHKQAVIRAITQ